MPRVMPKAVAADGVGCEVGDLFAAKRADGESPSSLTEFIFLVFDVEAIFLLPFAVAFTGFSAAESIAMLIFLLLLVEGLVWAYQKNILVWR